jgi:hypothetical protein
MSATTSHTLQLLAALATAALAAAAPAASQRPIGADSARSALEGTVLGRFDGSRRALGYAVIEAMGPGVSRSTVADSLGRYVLHGLPPGELRLRATHAGHESVSLTVLLPPRRMVRVDLELRADPMRLPRVNVVGDGTREPAEVNREPTPAANPEIELQSLDLGPGVGQPGLLETVRSLPGNDPADATDVLFMRGSTTDLKLVLLDGVPVYTPFHVAGLLRSFEPSVIGRADLHVGGAPARYDGGLTHILDLETRRARRDRARVSGAVDLLSASIATETPLGARAGVLVSARSLHDLGRAPLGGERPYGYRDLLMSLDAEPARGHGVRATAFWNDESVRLDFGAAANDAVWSNRAASLGYETEWAGVRLDFTVGASGYRAELPLQPAGEPNEPLPAAILASAAVDRLRGVAEASWGPVESPLRAGVSIDGIDAAYDASSTVSSARSRASTLTPGAFLDVTRPLAPGLTLRAGIRADVFNGTTARLAPRAALHWEVGPEALLTVAAGRYHQPTRTPDIEVERTLAEVADDALVGGELLPVATADHIVLSLDQRLAGRVSLGLEGFWKRFEGLQATGQETVRSSGVDLRVVSTGGAGVAWLGYGLSWFWSTLDLSGRASDFAGRHLLSAGVSGGLIGRLRGEARFAYGAGLPYTAIPFRTAGDELTGAPVNDAGGPGLETVSGGIDQPLVGGLDEEFLRIDLELHALWELEWWGRPWSVRPYVRVLNALDRRDALFYTFQRWRPDSVRPLAERPLLPLVGFAFAF